MSVFVDTNVLVYARDASQIDEQPRAETWMDRLWAVRQGRVSTQVLNEFYVTVTRKLQPGMSIADARADVRDLMSWQPITIDRDIVERAWTVEDRYGFSSWDALIVAAAQAQRCQYLLTQDLQDGQELDGVTVIDPFRHEPDVVMSAI